jgi:hypothetical protein
MIARRSWKSRNFIEEMRGVRITLSRNNVVRKAMRIAAGLSVRIDNELPTNDEPRLTSPIR